jgi:hypothetical protein
VILRAGIAERELFTAEVRTRRYWVVRLFRIQTISLFSALRDNWSRWKAFPRQWHIGWFSSDRQTEHPNKTGDQILLHFSPRKQLVAEWRSKGSYNYPPAKRGLKQFADRNRYASKICAPDGSYLIRLGSLIKSYRLQKSE